MFTLSYGLALSVLVGMMVSCSHQDPEALRVRHFQLQKTDEVGDSAQMTRGEQLYRLRGAVTLKERRERLGHYYTVEWERPSSARAGEGMRVVMNYQQAATASQVLEMSREIPADQTSGKMEFQVAGESYRVAGRVLAWQIRLMQGDRELAEKRSYLWK